MMFDEEEKPNYARYKLLRKKPYLPLSLYVQKSVFGKIPRCHARLNIFEELTKQLKQNSQEDNTMSNEKIEVSPYNTQTLEPNKTVIEDYLQSKSSAFFRPVSPTPRYGWGNYAEFLDWNKSHSETDMPTKRVFVK